MKAAKAAGLKVMLDGQGGDETLLGYSRYYPAIFAHWWGRRRWQQCAKEVMFAARESTLSLPRVIFMAL
jgi:asparagine synthase (glutamine-hydrolysing)